MTTIINQIEESRKEKSLENEIYKQKLFEQYFTPIDIAKYMTSLLSPSKKIENLNILDAGAGVGNLGAITSLKYLSLNNKVNLTSVEWDVKLINIIEHNMNIIKNEFNEFSYSIKNENFYTFANNKLEENKFYDKIIINPPYSLTSKGTKEEIDLLKKLDVKTPNAYTNFIELSCRLLSPKGELVAIIPRSFCNGTRFTKFRQKLITNMHIEFIHSFISRKEVFKEYGVFQEIVIIKLTKKITNEIKICISDKLNIKNSQTFNIKKVIFDNDPYKFIHIPDKEDDKKILNKIYKLPSDLKQLGLTISTGKVVEYREKCLISKKENTSAKMLYQRNLVNEKIDFKIESNSIPYLKATEESKHKILEPGNYIVMKRMSYKENKRRITSVILRESDFNKGTIAIENHLNYIHKEKKGFSIELAIGLNAYLNSETLDKYIRRFNGHTQINASDIISLPMPKSDILINIGKVIIKNKLSNDKIEELLFKG